LNRARVWTARPARLGKQRKLARGRWTFQIAEPCGVIAGKAVIGELRLHRIALVVAHDVVDPLDGEKRQRVAAHILAHFLQRMGCRQQVLAVRRVDTVIVWPRNRRAGDAHMHFLRAALVHHLYDLARGRPAHDAVVDQHDTFA
jgi:hypothetical protein